MGSIWTIVSPWLYCRCASVLSCCTVAKSGVYWASVRELPVLGLWQGALERVLGTPGTLLKSIGLRNRVLGVRAHGGLLLGYTYAEVCNPARSSWLHCAWP